MWGKHPLLRPSREDAGSLTVHKSVLAVMSAHRQSHSASGSPSARAWRARRRQADSDPSSFQIPSLRPTHRVCRRVSYSQDAHLFHVVVSNGIVYLCMADDVRPSSTLAVTQAAAGRHTFLLVTTCENCL